MGSSDSEHSPGKENKQSTSSTQSTSSAGNSLLVAAIQQAINVQILAQLSSMSDRLNGLEQHKVKKNSDPKKRKEFLKEVQYTSYPGHTATKSVPSILYA